MFWLTASATDEIQANVEEMQNEVSKLTELLDGALNKLIDFGFDVLSAIIIFVIGRIALKLIRKLFKNIFNKSNVDVGVVRFVDSFIKGIGYIIIIIIICGQIGIETTSLITLLGTASLSIGLALEGCLSNFAGGVLILVTKPFVVGDYVKIDGSQDVEGSVEKIDIIYTTLTTIDNKSIKIPNGTVANSILTNVTNQTKRRVDVMVGISYDDDVKKAKEIANDVMNSCKYIMSEEENVVVVKELGESSINLEIRMWTATDDYWNAKFDINERIKAEFDKNGISIPYNQLDVHVHQMDQ